MRPRIGLPTAVDERGRWRPGHSYHYLNAAYARRLEQAGAQVLYLPAQGAPEELIEAVDGLVVPGGDDLRPPPGAQPLPSDVGFDFVSRAQLEFDRALLAAALAGSKPVLGICYGMQLLALELGGSLYYDLQSELPAAAQHRLANARDTHPVLLEPSSHLARKIGPLSRVNSWHHQAVRDPGAQLSVCARAPDGVIEAIEDPHHPFCAGVQWHPERDPGPSAQRLFESFVAAARADPLATP